MTMTIGSLFAGIGGFDLGFERAGFKTVWQCEIDKAAQGVLRRRFPAAKLHSDVREVGAYNLEPVDVVTYGSPCQDLSISGKRAGLAGERSGLFHEAARIIRELRAAYGKPDFAIWENVLGAFSSNNGADFAAVVQTMVDLGARDVCWRVLDSRYFGVAQRRRRVFLVADFGGERAEQILFEPESLRGDIAPRRKARKEVARGAGAGAAEYGRVAPAITSKWAKGTGGPAGDECQNLVAQPICYAIMPQNSGKDFKAKISDVAQPLMAGGPVGGNQGGDYILEPIAFHPTQDPISSQDGVSHAMSTGNKTGGASVAVCSTMQVRRLMPIEAERLQGFPDGWTAEAALPDGTVKQQADGPRYKQLGNAVTVNVAEWIARRVAANLKP